MLDIVAIAKHGIRRKDAELWDLHLDVKIMGLGWNKVIYKKLMYCDVQAAWVICDIFEDYRESLDVRSTVSLRRCLASGANADGRITGRYVRNQPETTSRSRIPRYPNRNKPRFQCRTNRTCIALTVISNCTETTSYLVETGTS